MNALHAFASCTSVSLVVSLAAVASARGQDFSRFIPLCGGNRTPGIALGVVAANFVVVAGDASKVYVNDGHARFSDVRSLTVGEADAVAVALGDFNEDNYLDVVLGNLRGSSNSLYLNDRKGHFAMPMSFGAREDDTQAVAVADLDGDKHLDVVVGNMNGPDRVFFGDGRGTFGRSISFGCTRERRQVGGQRRTSALSCRKSSAI